MLLEGHELPIHKVFKVYQKVTSFGQAPTRLNYCVSVKRAGEIPGTLSEIPTLPILKLDFRRIDLI